MDYIPRYLCIYQTDTSFTTNNQQNDAENRKLILLFFIEIYLYYLLGLYVLSIQMKECI